MGSGEECDGNDFGGESCESLGWDGGDLSCTASCELDVSGCEGTGPECGNGMAEYGEQCDATDLGGSTCQDLGFSEGTLGCTTDCSFDTSGCSSPECGDGVAAGDERCDGTDLRGETCQSLGHESGTLACLPDCTYDRSGCEGTMPVCGDGTVDPGEQCDTDDLAGEDCGSLGYTGGTLACDASCQFDETGCFTAECGNGIAEAGEECDATDLGGEDCLSLGYMAGALACNPDCTYDESGCSNAVCGNGIAEAGEECDASDLAGEDCVSLGYTGGTLACDQGCTFVVDGCVGGCSPTGGSLACDDSFTDDTSTSPDAVDAIDDWTGPDCLQWQMDGPEIIYSFVSAGTDQGVAVSLTSLSADLDLIVLEGQGSGCGANLPCVDWSDTPQLGDESVEFAAMADVTYYIVVDGYAQNEGSFDLAFQCVELEDCTDGVDNDGDGLVDCEDVTDCDGVPECLVEAVFELFPVNDPNHEWDLDSTTITLTPDPNAPGGYTWSTQHGVTDYPTTPGSGATSTPVTFAQKDDTMEVTFNSNEVFPFYGQTYGSMWVNSQGSVTFGEGDIEFEESEVALFTGPPRVAGHWDNFDVTQGGTVTVDEMNDRVAVTWDQIQDNFYGGTHSFQVELYWSGEITITNLTHDGVDGLVGVCSGSGNHGPQQVDFFDSSTLPPIPGFYELFDPQQGDTFDLDGTLITYLPDAQTQQGYTFSVTDTTTAFPFPPGTGTVSSQQLTFGGGDTSAEVTFTTPYTVPFFGQSRDGFFVGTNGYVTFDSGDTDWTPGRDDHFDMARMSGLFDDWEPQNGGEVWVDEFDVGGVGYVIAVTFVNVPHYGNPHPTASFQISIREDGTIMYFYDGVNTQGGLVGMSSGESGPYPQETDYLP
jgi:hypothetical protein